LYFGGLGYFAKENNEIAKRSWLYAKGFKALTVWGNLGREIEM